MLCSSNSQMPASVCIVAGRTVSAGATTWWVNNCQGMLRPFQYRKGTRTEYRSILLFVLETPSCCQHTPWASQLG